PEADVREALGAVDTLIFTGANANRTSARAHWVLPAAAWGERGGRYTNLGGLVQRFRKPAQPLGQALPEWQMLGRVLTALGAAPTATRAEHWFRELVGAVPALARLTYQPVRATGRLVTL